MFSIVKDLQQGSKEWLEFRRKHITATDAGKILQEVPLNWGTPYSLWLDKIMGREKEINERMKGGIELEPFARSAYEDIKGESFEPLVIINDARPWQMASLDGISKDLNRCVEFKCGEAAYNSAKEGKVKDYYVPQLQHILAVTGHDSIDYACFWCDDMIIINVPRDEEYIATLIEKEQMFYDCLVNFKEPERGPLEYYQVRGEKAIFHKERLQHAIEKKKELEEFIEQEKQALIEIAADRNIEIEGLKVRKCVRKGNIQYKNIPELSKIDIEIYRGKPTEYYSFKYAIRGETQ